MKIGVLGGSFNPPHIGHAIMAQQILEKFKLDEIWLMPAYSHPFDKNLIPAIDRLNMTKFLGSEKIKVSSFEVKQKKTNYTINTLSLLNKEFPNDTFYWIIGSDQLGSFKKWKDWQKLISDYGFIIFPRPKISVPIIGLIKDGLGLKKIPKNILYLEPKDLILVELSSTDIRKRIKLGKSIKFMVSEKIEKYILLKKLYNK